MQRTHLLHDCARHGVALCALEKSVTPYTRENLKQVCRLHEDKAGRLVNLVGI
jgi:hypothetical protein